VDLQGIADELYGLPPENFTAARDAAARAADKPLKAQVKALRRPTVSAWLVNRLARDRAELLDQLLGLGPALAQAQAQGSGDALRQLGAQRRELVAAVTGTAVHDAGREVSPANRVEVEQTLEAALADPATADAVRSGCLVRAVSYAGFGGVDLDGAVAVSVPLPAARRQEEERAQPSDALPRAEAAALDAAAALDDAVRACEAAQRAHASAERDLTAAQEQRAEADDALADLEERLTRARADRDDAVRAEKHSRTVVEHAERKAGTAARAVEQAQGAAEQARAALDALRRRR
jgi:hypothetical protein